MVCVEVGGLEATGAECAEVKQERAEQRRWERMGTRRRGKTRAAGGARAWAGEAHLVELREVRSVDSFVAEHAVHGEEARGLEAVLWGGEEGQKALGAACSEGAGDEADPWVC